MADLSRKLSRLKKQFRDVQRRDSEKLHSKYSNELLRYAVVNFFKEKGSIPEDYTDPEYERARRIAESLPEVPYGGGTDISTEELTRSWYSAIKHLISAQGIEKYIPNFEDIKLKSLDELYRELGI